MRHTRYRWLQVSDLHAYFSGVLTRIMRKAMINKIQSMQKENAFDFLLITGDLFDKDHGYNEAKCFIEAIIQATGVSTDRVFIVPGNHDVDRNIPDCRKTIAESCWEKASLKNLENEMVQKLVPGQQEFFDLYEEILGRKYPVDKLHFIEELDNNIAIIHLNTAWMCYDSEREKEKLHIGLTHVYECLEDDRLSCKRVNIAIGHHPVEDFSRTVRSNLKTLFKTQNIDLYLSGHCHESGARYDVGDDIDYCSCRQARAAKGVYEAGFVIGDIDIDGAGSSLYFYRWNRDDSQWCTDSAVRDAEMGKYTLRATRLASIFRSRQDVVIDLKCMGAPLDYINTFRAMDIRDPEIHAAKISTERLISSNEWTLGLDEIKRLCKGMLEGNNKVTHVFPVAPIPLLVAFGYLLQNDNENIRIYQYYENENKWVYDERQDDFQVHEKIIENGSKRLAVVLNISAVVDENDIKSVLGEDYDLFSVGIERPRLSVLNYHKDILKVKNTLKSKLDVLQSRYNKIHLFLASPAGLCIEVGRIIRKNMYPDTYVYNFERGSNPKYKNIFNLKHI